MCTVAQSDGRGVACATVTDSTLLSASFALGTPSRTDDSSGIRTKRAAVRHLDFLRARSQFPPGEPLGVSPLPNRPIRDIALTKQNKQLLTELRRASVMPLPRCVVSRYATAWAESLEGAMSGHQSWALLCRCRCRLFLAERYPQELGAETTASSVGNGANQRSDLQGPGSAEFWTASQNSKECAVTDRRTAREGSVRFGSAWIHRQSHEVIGRWCCAGLGGLSQELDHSPHSAEFGHWNSSHQCGVCRGGPNRLGRGAMQAGAERDDGAGTEHNKHRFVAACQTVAIECSWSRWRTARTSGCQCFLRRRWPQESLVSGLTSSRSSGQQEICWKSAASCSTAADVPEERKRPDHEAVR